MHALKLCAAMAATLIASAAFGPAAAQSYDTPPPVQKKAKNIGIGPCRSFAVLGRGRAAKGTRRGPATDGFADHATPGLAIGGSMTAGTRHGRYLVTGYL